MGNLQHAFIYTGARTIEGLVAVRSWARAVGRPFFIVHVTARSATRLARAVERRRGSEEVDPLSFDRDSARDAAYGSAKYGSLVCDIELRNDGDLGSFTRRFDKSLARALCGNSSRTASRSRKAQVRVSRDRELSIDTRPTPEGIALLMLAGTLESEIEVEVGSAGWIANS